MKFSEQWLREWVNPPITSEQLVEKMTLAGLEVESIEPVAANFTQVVVGEVKQVTAHPDADRLRVCQVDIGEAQLLSIVCGAENVRETLKVAVAKIDAVLPGDFKIKKSKLRGVESFGMLCSENELGLAQETAPGIMELPLDAPIGVDLHDYLQLSDTIIDINVTANRGDCLSIQGLAREVAAICKQSFTIPFKELQLAANKTLTLPVTNHASSGCSHYLGRVISGINPQATTPLWMIEKLRRSGIRSVSLIVDITNFVMLELGQPLHSFDLHPVSTGIEIRYAQHNELITLLDEQVLKLTSDDLVITSNKQPVALAGIMGGRDSSITSQTHSVFLESALFTPAVVAQTSRKFALFTDSSHRFERGVDFYLQRQAIARASQLIIELLGGELGEIIEIGEVPKQQPAILLRAARITSILGIHLRDHEVEELLSNLGMQAKATTGGWLVSSPSYRHDIASEIDLIEELARLYGYDQIPSQKLNAELRFLPTLESQLNIKHLKNTLVARDYQEAITYSFVNPQYEKLLGLAEQPLEIINPIASDLAVMRSNHWPGLIRAYQYNYHRQQARVRLFEVGLCFSNLPNELKQNLRLGGLCAGLVFKEQWGESKRQVDFFDVKADVENLLGHIAGKRKLQFKPCEQPALHPGKAASLFLEDKYIGSFGAIHPNIAQKLDINQSLYLFDIDLDSIMELPLQTYEAISKFPAIRRDVALVVTTDVPAEKIKEKILDSGGGLLKNVQIFDVYQGKGIDPDKKSIALSLFFQHNSRTLVDAEINAFMQTIVSALHKEFDAILRD
jgi:phenylalanyl-tRNA synthetase beta chain